MAKKKKIEETKEQDKEQKELVQETTEFKMDDYSSHPKFDKFKKIKN